jgi:nicotinamide riboside kinase
VVIHGAEFSSGQDMLAHAISKAISTWAPRRYNQALNQATLFFGKEISLVQFNSIITIQEDYISLIQ